MIQWPSNFIWTLCDRKYLSSKQPTCCAARNPLAWRLTISRNWKRHEELAIHLSTNSFPPNQSPPSVPRILLETAQSLARGCTAPIDFRDRVDPPFLKRRHAAGTPGASARSDTQ